MSDIIIPAHTRYESKVEDWLQSFHLFSFAQYYDPNNMAFGNLRVFNDDYIAGNSGFGLHPHDNMEILTILLEGSITHGDTLGNSETTAKGELQTMSAGSGLFHSEQNLSDDTAHLYQLWFLPREKNTKPNYKKYPIIQKENELTLIVSGDKTDETAYLNTDIKVFLGKYSRAGSFTYEIKEGKGLFLYITSGEILWKDKTLKTGDQLRATSVGIHSFQIPENTEFILMEVTF